MYLLQKVLSTSLSIHTAQLLSSGAKVMGSFRGKYKEVKEMQGLIKIPEVAKVLQEIGTKKK